jgi:hypothetical protein
MQHRTAFLILSLFLAGDSCCWILAFAPSSMIVRKTGTDSSSRNAGDGNTFLPSLTLLRAQNQKPTTGHNELTARNTGKDKNKNNSNADFEYQEMRAILTAMEQRNIQTLEPIKRAELESYITKVVQQHIPPQQVPPLTAQNLVNTKYRLAFSNQKVAATNLPAGASVVLEFLSDGTTLNYRLQFSEKIFGLDNINAKCSYTLDEATGLLTFVYNSVTTDLFGLQNLPVGLFGQLKGRTSYIVSSYFDGDYWIEVAYDSPQQTSTYTNVYDQEVILLNVHDQQKRRA